MDIETLMGQAAGRSPDNAPYALIVRRVRRRRLIRRTSATLGVLAVIAVSGALAAERRPAVVEFGPAVPVAESPATDQASEWARPPPQQESRCPKLMDALPGRGVARSWGDFPWRDYGFDDVTIPAEIAGLRVGSVNCTEDGIADKATAVFTDLYDPARNGKDVAALLLIGEEGPGEVETWEGYLRSTFPGDWGFTRTGSVLVGTPRAEDGARARRHAGLPRCDPPSPDAPTEPPPFPADHPAAERCKSSGPTSITDGFKKRPAPPP